MALEWQENIDGEFLLVIRFIKKQLFCKTTANLAVTYSSESVTCI